MNKKIFDELSVWAQERSKMDKVARVYYKCIRQRHLELADRIRAKHWRYFPQDDSIIAFAMALQAQKTKGE